MNTDETITLNIRDEPKTVRFADTVRSAYSRRDKSFFKEFTARFFAISQMDFQYSFLEMLMLIIDPKKAYLMTKWNYQIRNAWERRDHSFLLLLIIFLVVLSVAYTVAFGSTISDYLISLYKFILIHFGICGFIIMNATKLIALNYMKKTDERDQDISTLYVVDVYCNAFFVYLMFNYTLQFLLSPFLISNHFFSILLSNLIYFLANFKFYLLLFRGYQILPFLHKTEYFLLPILFHFIQVIVMIILKISSFKLIIDYYL